MSTRQSLVIASFILILLPTGCWAQGSWLNPLETDTHTLFICHWDNANDTTLKSAAGIEALSTKNPANNPTYAPGKWDKGLEFLSNTSPLQYPIKSNLNLHSGTIEFWFKPATPDFRDKTHYFFLAPTGWADGWKNKISFTYHVNRLRVLIGDKDGKIYFLEIPDIFLKTGEWYHLGFSWKTNQGAGNDAVKIFCNGETIGNWTGLTINLEGISAGNFVLGSEEAEKPAWSMDGIIDEFRISDNWREYSPAGNAKSFFETNALSIYLSKDWNWEAELNKARTMAVPAVSGRIINVFGQAAPGGDGSETHPFATIGEAAKQAQAGDRLLIKGGTYRESVPLKSGLQVFAKAGEEVILNGARVVTGWKFDQATNSYVADGINLEYDFPGIQECLPDIVSPLNKHPNLPEISFCDGKLLERCDDVPDLQKQENAFYWDRSVGKVYVRLSGEENPSKHLMEVGVKRTAFEGGGDDIVLQGLTITHYASPMMIFPAQDTYGGLMIMGNNWLVENCNVLYNRNAGIILAGHNNIIRNCKSNHNGWLGFFANWGTSHNTIIDSEASYNSWKHVNPDHGSGGMKFCVTKNYIVSGCTANYDTYGPGIWFDVDCRNTIITNNVVIGNSCHAGIMYEISCAGLIKNNFCAFNRDVRSTFGGGGVLLQLTAGCVVEDNVFMENQHGLVITQADRPKSTISAHNNAENNYWFAHDNVMKNNIFMDTKDNAVVIWNWKTSTSRPTFDDFKNISGKNYFISTKEGDIKLNWNDITTLKAAQERGYEQGSKLIKLEDDNANY